MQGIIFSNSKDVVYIERASFMYKTFLSRSLSKELSSLLHRLLDFLKSLTLNCVDLKRLSSAIEVPTADVELDFKDNIVVDLTTRYSTYKKLLFKSSGEEKGLQINTNQGDENVSIASSYLYKLQDDKFFSLVCKYRSLIRKLLAKVQVFIYLFEDVKDVQFQDQLTPIPDQSPSKEPSQPEKFVLSAFNGSSGNKILKSGVVSSSDGTSVDQSGVKTPRKKGNSSLQINLDKDSNSKKLESKFRFDSADDNGSANRKEMFSRRMIIQNFEAVIECCDENKRGSLNRVLDLEEKSVKTSKSSVILDSSQLADFGERFGSIQSRTRQLPKEESGGCNPCSLI